MGDDTINVRTFVDRAFPSSTIPMDLQKDSDGSRPYREASWNFVGFSNWGSGERYHPMPDSAERKAQPPFWPADLFAVTAQLLERSGAYQRLADQISLVRPSAGDPDWAALVHPENENLGKAFGVNGHHRLLLRLVGALWGHGALTISGIHKGDVLVPKEDIAKENRLAADRAIKFLNRRQSQEINQGHLDSLVQEILDSTVSKFGMNTQPADADKIHAGNASLITTSGARLALEAICKRLFGKSDLGFPLGLKHDSGGGCGAQRAVAGLPILSARRSAIRVT